MLSGTAGECSGGRVAFGVPPSRMSSDLVRRATTDRVLEVVGERRRLRRRRGVGRGVARVATPLVVVAALVVLAVGAVAQIGPASGPDRRIVDRSFAVLAAPIVAQSNASGSLLNAVLKRGPSLGRTTFFSELASITTDAATDDRLFSALIPPAPPGGVADGCTTAMADRRFAAARIADALGRLLGGRRGLGGGDEATAARTLTAAGATLASADASWAACRRSLRRAPGSARLAASTWISDRGLFGQAAVGPFVAALVGSASLLAVHRLTLLTWSTDPAAVPGAVWPSACCRRRGHCACGSCWPTRATSTNRG